MRSINIIAAIILLLCITGCTRPMTYVYRSPLYDRNATPSGIPHNCTIKSRGMTFTVMYSFLVREDYLKYAENNYDIASINIRLKEHFRNLISKIPDKTIEKLIAEEKLARDKRKLRQRIGNELEGKFFCGQYTVFDDVRQSPDLVKVRGKTHQLPSRLIIFDVEVVFYKPIWM